LLSRIGLDLTPTCPAPDDQADAGGRRGAQVIGGSGRVSTARSKVSKAIVAS
jgi:hypothetical protein